MEEIGLIPTDTGWPGGKRTGQSVTHCIEPDGKFDNVAKRLLQTGGHIHWKSYSAGPSTSKSKGKSGKRIKYTCSSCGLNAWAKPDVQIVCGTCEEELTAA